MNRIKTETYEGKKSVLVICEDCPKYKCFAPHNMNRYGRGKEDWRCATNHGRGCPETPQLKTSK